jgi:autotransporter-associated beta strand protein
VSGGGSFAGVIQNGTNPGALTVSGSTLTLSNAETYTGLTTISAGTLALGSGGSLYSGGSVIANGVFDISQSGNQTIGDLSGSGVVDLGGYQLEISDTNTTTFSGQINNGGLGGGTGGSLLVDGEGVLILSGSNGFTGATTVGQNTMVEYESSAAFAQTSAITVQSGGAIQLSGGIAGGSKSVSIAGTGFAGSHNAALDSVSGGNSLAGVVNLTSNAAISTDSGTLNLSGGVSEGAHTLTVKGAGETAIGAITGSTGGLTVNATGGLVDLTGSNT